MLHFYSRCWIFEMIHKGTNMKYIVWIMAILLAGCTSAPKNIDPVTQFQLERYLGTWYEIVRQDHAFEEGLSEVTATYTQQDDGGVGVLNRGYSVEEKDWREAKGRAYFVDSSDIGYLKVSFFILINNFTATYGTKITPTSVVIVFTKI